ncbi:MAG: hypothetical protein ACRECV_04580 [Xanthobacteraceae bacterium]
MHKMPRDTLEVGVFEAWIGIALAGDADCEPAMLVMDAGYSTD